MRRFPISRLMLLVALLAADLGTVRALVDRPSDDEESRALLVGLLPLFNAVAIAAWAASTRYRISVRRRLASGRGGHAAWFALAGMLLLMGVLVAFMIAPGTSSLTSSAPGSRSTAS